MITGVSPYFDRETAKLYLNGGVATSASGICCPANFEDLLFPDPADTRKITYRINAKKAGPIHIRIIDLNGRHINLYREWALGGSQTFSLDISSLAGGSYLLRIDDGRSTSTQKFLVH